VFVFPTLFHLGPFVIRSYGVLLALSFLVGVPLAARRAKKDGLDPEVILSMAWTIVVSGVAGARILYILQHPSGFIADPMEVFRLWNGGLTLFGGLALATLTTILVLRKKAGRSWAYTDALAPFVAFGEGLTRIGCFLNGCCFGRACTLPWAVTFPQDSYVSTTMGYPHALHPSQLYQSALGFLLFAVTTYVWKRRSFDGQVFWVFVMGEGVSRFIADFFRYYEGAQVVSLMGAPISESQLASIGFVVFGALGYGIRRRRTVEHARAA
jgi:phosphatidylglycerol:prolipoprotein diacylglycerol transferase